VCDIVVKKFTFAISSLDEFLLYLALPYISSLQVIVETSNLVSGLSIESPSLQMINRP